MTEQYIPEQSSIDSSAGNITGEKSPFPYDIFLLKRAKILQTPRIEQPSSVEEVITNLTHDFAKVRDIKGFRISPHNVFGLIGTIYYKGDTGTDEDFENEKRAQITLDDDLEKLGKESIFFAWAVNVEDSSIEEILREQESLPKLTPNQKSVLSEGGIPDGMDWVDATLVSFEIAAGLDEYPVGRSLVIEYTE